MAMFPIATKGYMPFVHGKTHTTTKNKRSKHHVNGGKLHKSENKLGLTGTMKMYQITVKDKKGNTFKYIVKGDGTKSLPELCEERLNSIVATHRSMPNIGEAVVNSPSRQRQVLAEKIDALNSVNTSDENFSTSLDLRECGKKEGIFSAFIRFIKERTSKSDSKAKKLKSKPGKSKRKPRDVTQRKRQRTVSAMSNLDPIQESPNEHEFEDDEDADSYLHYSSSPTDSDASSVASSISCSIEKVDDESS